MAEARRIRGELDHQWGGLVGQLASRTDRPGGLTAVDPSLVPPLALTAVAPATSHS